MLLTNQNAEIVACILLKKKTLLLSCRSRFEDIEDVVDLTHCLSSTSAHQRNSSSETR